MRARSRRSSTIDVDVLALGVRGERDRADRAGAGTRRASSSTARPIVNITSDAAVEAYEGWGGYGASKAALEHASRVLAAERPDLRVLVVDPGDMRTEMHQDAFPGEDISDRPEPTASVPGLMTLITGDATERSLRSTRARARRTEAAMTAMLDDQRARLRPRRRARSARAARGARAARATTCGCSSAPGAPNRSTPASPTSAAFLARRRPRRREHVGHDPRRARRPPARRRTGRRAPLGRAAGRRVAGRGPPPAATAAPRRCSSTRPGADRAARRRLRRSARAVRRLATPVAGASSSIHASRVTDYLSEHGRPIRYRHVPRDWPLASYQTIFAREPGSAEMPSASRPFTPELVTDLVARGVLIARSSCTPACRHSKAAKRRTPSATASPRAPPPSSTRSATTAGACRRRHHRGARARDRHRRPRRRPPGPGLDRRRRDARRRRRPRSTACSPAGTSPSRHT